MPDEEMSTESITDKAVLWYPSCRDIVIEAIGENEFAVFNGDFWDSSLFNEIDVCLLRHLLAQEAPKRLDELLSQVSLELGMSTEDALTHYVGQSLVQMEYIGLIRRGTVR